MWFLRRIVHKWREIGVGRFIFRSIAPNRQGAPPKLTKRFLRFRPIARFRVHPLRGSTPPKWPLYIVRLGSLVKTNFVWGGSPPIWGRYGGLKFSTGVYFGLDFLETPSSDFGILSPLDRGPPPPGTLKIWAKSEEPNSRNVRPNLAPRPSTFALSADFARSSSAPFGLPAPGLPPIGVAHARLRPRKV